MVNSIINTFKVGFSICAMAAVCSAAGAVASVTSAQPFSVDGVQLSNPGVSSWPLISSDEIATTNGAALMTFGDGSAVKLAPQSRVRLAGTTTSPHIYLIAGNVDTKLAPGSRLLVTRSAETGGADDNGTPDYAAANTGARSNNNTPFRKAVLLYALTGTTLSGLGLAVDAILQPTAASTR